MQSNKKIQRRSAIIACAVLTGILVNLLLVVFTTAVYTNIAVLTVDSNIAEPGTEKDIERNYDCILVLGAGLRSDGTPSDMLADRLKVACALYESGASSIIILSGDRSGQDYDEVTAMRTYLQNMGVPSDAMIDDGEGYSTYESVYNLKAEDKYDSVVIVTQKSHLYRAMYIAEEMGFDADGADAALRGYSGQIYRDLREIAARTKDFFMVEFGGESV